VTLSKTQNYKIIFLLINLQSVKAIKISHLQPEPTINRHQIVEIIMTLPTIILRRPKITYQANPDGTITFVKSIPEATTNAQNHKEYK
tara:strand:- start:885 stop:1148 length:264 start_codon:yes stop_codon:yes gene_type:complete